MQLPFVETDWVKARSGTATQAAFQRLLVGVRKDVNTRNATRKPGDTFRFEAIDSGNECDVIRHDAAGPMHVRFVLLNSGIEARGDGMTLRATLTLDCEGHSTLNVNGVLTEDWHFRQMALEFLFFDVQVSAALQPIAPARGMPPLTPTDVTRGYSDGERRYRQSDHKSGPILIYTTP